MSNPGNPRSEGIAGVIRTFLLFVFYVIIDDVIYFVVPTGKSPIIEQEFKKITAAVSALKALLARGLVPQGISEPQNVYLVQNLLGYPAVYFVQLDVNSLVAKRKNFCSAKLYSLGDPKTGRSQGGKDLSVKGFGVNEYSILFTSLLSKVSSASSPLLAEFASGGGGGVAVAAPLCHGVRKSQPAPTCGHAQCFWAGLDGIVIPFFEHQCIDGSKKSVVILVHDQGYWNFFMYSREKTDGCWVEAIEKELVTTGKIFLSRRLNDSDITKCNSIHRCTVFKVNLEPTMVEHDFSCGDLNAQVAGDSTIGFFELDGKSLVPCNPSDLQNKFSDMVISWLSY